jgi:hypothetical protein
MCGSAAAEQPRGVLLSLTSIRIYKSLEERRSRADVPLSLWERVRERAECLRAIASPDGS